MSRNILTYYHFDSFKQIRRKLYGSKITKM